MTTPAPTNVYGRRAGRGLRPWLLVPKVLVVGCFLGGLVTVLVLMSADQPPDQDTARWQSLVSLVGLIFRAVIVPASVAAALLGVLLTLQAPRVLLAQRWLQVKLLILVVMLPPLHLFTRYQFHRVRLAAATPASATVDSAGPAGPMQLVMGSVAVAILVVVLVILLARVKPRLGQNWAQTYLRLRRRDSE